MHERRSPSARSRGGNRVSPARPLLCAWPRRARRAERCARRGDRAGKPFGFPWSPFPGSCVAERRMSVIRIPPTLRGDVGGARQVEADGGTVRELLDDLLSRFPSLREQIV